MRSRADTVASGRLLFERCCRAIAFMALGAGVVAAFMAHRVDDRRGASRLVALGTVGATDTAGEQGDGPTVAQRELAVLQRMVQDPRTAHDTLLMSLDKLPTSATRAALGAMQSAGQPMTWVDHTRALGLALSITRDATPRATFDVRVSRPAASVLTLRDAGGLLDSIGAASTTDSLTTATPHVPTVDGWRIVSLTAPVRARVGASVAVQQTVDSASPKRVLVMAQPGWESKFTIAALEELGWLVDGALRISPTGVSTVGAPQRLDTARYAAVVVLDSMAVDAALVRRFVMQGGGLLLSGDALRVPSLAALRPVRATEIRNATPGALLTSSPRQGLDAWELAVAADAEPVLRDAGSHGHDEVVVVARRLGAGRVVASAYRQSWRWRMEGTDDGITDHRRWWGRLVALTVPEGVRVAPAVGAWPGDVAPYADLVALAGAPLDSLPAMNRANGGSRGFGGQVPAILFVLAALTLLAEWASRRLRGLR